MFDNRTKLAVGVVEEVRKHFTTQVLDTIIPRSVRVSEAPGYAQTVITYDRSNSGSIAYLEAAGEIAIRGAQNGR
jgi:chromosome partitioning protein